MMNTPLKMEDVIFNLKMRLNLRLNEATTVSEYNRIIDEVYLQARPEFKAVGWEPMPRIDTEAFPHVIKSHIYAEELVTIETPVRNVKLQEAIGHAIGDS